MDRARGGAVECVFCRIASGAVPSYVFYEDATSLGILDLFPYTRGHALVVPKRHVDRLTDLAPDDRSPFVVALQNVCRRIERLSPHYNVGLNQGAYAGQVVFHLHFHVIPRYDESDPFRAGARDRLDDGEAKSLIALLAPEADA
jgi:histidine triad (HIT) family protein